MFQGIPDNIFMMLFLEYFYWGDVKDWDNKLSLEITVRTLIPFFFFLLCIHIHYIPLFYYLTCQTRLFWIKVLFFVFFFLWPHSQDMDIPRPGTVSELQLWTTLQLQQCQILHSTMLGQRLTSAVTWAAAVRSLIHCTTAGTLPIHIFCCLFL